MNSRLVRFCAAAVAIGGLLAVSISAARVEPTVASWRTDSYTNATLSTVKLNPVTSMACNPMSALLSTTIPLTWTQPTLTGTGPPPDSYTITLARPSTTPISATSTTTSYEIPGSALSLLANGTVTIVANYTNSAGTVVWTSAVSTQRIKITTVLGVLGVFVGYSCAIEANP
jgi:hypothetical protein